MCEIIDPKRSDIYIKITNNVMSEDIRVNSNRKRAYVSSFTNIFGPILLLLLPCTQQLLVRTKNTYPRTKIRAVTPYPRLPRIVKSSCLRTISLFPSLWEQRQKLANFKEIFVSWDFSKKTTTTTCTRKVEI